MLVVKVKVFVYLDNSSSTANLNKYFLKISLTIKFIIYTVQ